MQLRCQAETGVKVTVIQTRLLGWCGSLGFQKLVKATLSNYEMRKLGEQNLRMFLLLTLVHCQEMAKHIYVLSTSNVASEVDISFYLAAALLTEKSGGFIS